MNEEQIQRHNYEADDVVAVLELKMRRNGAMSVAGQIGDKQYALMMLDAARDALENYHLRQEANKGLIIPPSAMQA